MMTSPLDGRIDGTLTARGVTRPITLAVHFSRPPAQRAAAGASMTLTATARIDRNDYGMRAYPLIVGSRVTVTINAQLTPA
jgi:polyisoprenoid-binding protein YceI